MSIIARTLEWINDARAFHLGTHNPGVTVRPADRPATDQDWADAGAPPVPQPPSGTAPATAALPPSPAYVPIQPALEALAAKIIANRQPNPGDPMSTAAVVTEPTAPTAAPAAKKENAFERFIDKIIPFLKKETPVAEELADAARPLLALSPIGPEYNIVLTGIETAIQADQAVVAAAGKPLTGSQKMAVALSVATPALTNILQSKGVTTPTAITTAIQEFAQNVYNLQTGPVVAVKAA